MDTREDTDGLVEVEDGPGECPREQSALAKTREWRVWLRNGWVLRETLAIFKIAAPMVANNFFYQVMFTVALVFVGNSSGRSLELDAAALALSFMNVTGVSVGIGLATAAETLCAQVKLCIVQLM
ncbi:Protein DETOXIFICATION 14 [Geodia barretti]|uniref:Protein DETOXIFICATION 14 n=1 Tax=Geodia barretti TaxID=519541 RepID=A0AA35R8U3_GEOBA|nr:Protein DETOXIFICATION 14 [Geodia barretti]